MSGIKSTHVDIKIEKDAGKTRHYLVLQRWNKDNDWVPLSLHNNIKSAELEIGEKIQREIETSRQFRTDVRHDDILLISFDLPI